MQHVPLARMGKLVGFASGSPRTEASIWSLETGKIIARPRYNFSDHILMKFSFDQRYFATVAAAGDGRRVEDDVLALWSMPDAAKQEDGFHEFPVLLKGHTDYITNVSFSPNTDLLVTASADKTARIWEPVRGGETYFGYGRRGPLVANLGGHRSRVVSADFSPDGKRIVTDFP